MLSPNFLELPKAAAMTLLRLFFVAQCLFMAAASPVLAAPKAEPWQRWTAHDPASALVVDHGPWQRFLEAYVVGGDDGVNRVAYGRIPAKDKAALEGYIDRLAAVPVSNLGRPEQLAFWINLYNALTLKVVLDHYPVASIRDIDISPGLLADGPWGKKLLEVERFPVSLDDIEHRILRPIWKDPRIHYVVNCAAISCPNLPATAFTAANAKALLNAAARAYVNHRRGASIDNGRLIVSSIYDWYMADFGGGVEGVLDHLRRYAEADLKARLRGITGIAGDVYDWALNEAR